MGKKKKQKEKKEEKKEEKKNKLLKAGKKEQPLKADAPEERPFGAESVRREVSDLAMPEPAQMAKMLHALGDESRMRILMLLAGGELCGADLLKQVSIVQSTLSHHMKVMTDAGIVRCRKQGKWSYYSIDAITFQRIGKFMMKWGDTDGENKVL